MRKIVKEIVFSFLFILMVIGFIPFCLVIRGHGASVSYIQAKDIPDGENPYREIIMNATPEELTELEQVLYLEAGIDTFEGRIATCQVILNRVLDQRGYFPDTIHGVLSQEGQYSTYKNRNKAKYGEQESDVIEWLCDGGPWLLTLDYVYQDVSKHGYDCKKIGKQWYGKAK